MSTEPEEPALPSQEASTDATQKEEPWLQPEAGKIARAIAWRSSKNRPATTYRTRVFGMRSSRDKDNELFWAHRTVTNLTSGVWATAWQDIQQHKTRSMPFSEITAECRALPSEQAYRPKPGFMAFMLRELRRHKTKLWILGKPEGVLLNLV